MVLPGAKRALYRYSENTYSIYLAVSLSGHEAISRVLDQIEEHLSEASSKNRFTHSNKRELLYYKPTIDCLLLGFCFFTSLVNRSCDVREDFS
jgi:hypothetical protein